MVKLGYLDRGHDPAPMVEVVRILFEPVMVDGVFDPTDYDSVGKATAVGEIALRAQALQIAAAQRVPAARADRAGRNHQRARDRANYRAIFRECVEAVAA